MYWEHNFKVEKPSTLDGLDKLDAEIFVELRANYPHTQNHVETWRKGHVLENKRTPLLNILSDITEGVCDYIGEATGIVPNEIQHSIRTTPVRPRQAQLNLASPWHADGKLEAVRPIVFMSADNMPTEFLIPGPMADGKTERRWIERPYARATSNLFKKQIIDEGISMGLFDIYRPQPFEGSLTQGNIHRSPTNFSMSPAERTFFLVWVDSNQWLK